MTCQSSAETPSAVGGRTTISSADGLSAVGGQSGVPSADERCCIGGQNGAASADEFWGCHQPLQRELRQFTARPTYHFFAVILLTFVVWAAGRTLAVGVVVPFFLRLSALFGCILCNNLIDVLVNGIGYSRCMIVNCPLCIVVIENIGSGTFVFDADPPDASSIDFMCVFAVSILSFSCCDCAIPRTGHENTAQKMPALRIFFIVFIMLYY